MNMGPLQDQTKSISPTSGGILFGAMRNTVSDKISRIRGTSIKAKSARAVMKLGIGTTLGQSMKLARRMILARLLAPSEIGVMAIVFSVSVAFEALTEVGVKQSVIQNKKGANTDYLNVAWWMQMARGLCLLGIAFILAPWISSFYDKPRLVGLLRVAFLGIAFRSLVSPRAYVLEKEYKFGRAVFLTQGSGVLGVIITVSLAFVMRNVWALVIGSVAEMAILCLLSFVLVPFLPTFRIDRQSLDELLKFARGMFGLSILAAISFQAPVLILGKVILDTQLGLYSFAAFLPYIPVDLFMRVVNPVLLPAFSQKQDDKMALCRGIFQSTQWAAVLALPLVAFMACCGPEILFVAFGPEYAGMALVLAVLCLEILARYGALILAGVYFAVGMPHLQRRFVVTRALVIVALMYPAAVRYGPMGAAVVVVLSNFVLLLMQVFQARKVIDLRLGRYLRSYVPGLLLSLPIIAAFDLFWLFGIDSPILVLIVGVSMFVAALAVGASVLGRSESLPATAGEAGDGSEYASSYGIQGGSEEQSSEVGI